jgi:uncharacterized membrane protein
MIRDKLIAQETGMRPGFRWRGQDVSRLEGLSDAVFGFAITLLVVSLEAPRTFSQLYELMHGFVAFAFSFALLLLVWYQHYQFFRRYGLQDTATMLLNSALLFVVLFYVYPLKFLSTVLISIFFLGGRGLTVTRANGVVEPVIAGQQMRTVMIVFGLGYVAVFFVFTLLYLHAYRRRDALELSELELFDTRTELLSHLINVGIGLLSITIAATGVLGRGSAGWAGFCYMLLAIVMPLHGILNGRRRKRLRPEARAAKAA